MFVEVFPLQGLLVSIMIDILCVVALYISLTEHGNVCTNCILNSELRSLQSMTLCLWYNSLAKGLLMKSTKARQTKFMVYCHRLFDLTWRQAVTIRFHTSKRVPETLGLNSRSPRPHPSQRSRGQGQSAIYLLYTIFLRKSKNWVTINYKHSVPGLIITCEGFNQLLVMTNIPQNTLLHFSGHKRT